MSLPEVLADQPTPPPGTRLAADGAVPDEVNPEILAREPRNMVLIAIYEIVLRIGWVFKTESVIVPAFLDTVAGAGWLRGVLPVLSRLGQSVPPVLFANRLRQMSHKKWSLAAWSLMMGLPFLVLSIAWYFVGDSPPGWMAILFLLMYAMFSCAYGLNQLSCGTVQGKLIRANRRGRLMAFMLPAGSFCAILFAIWLMGGWLQLSNGGFNLIFGFTGVCFLLAAAVATAISEPGDGSSLPHHQKTHRPFAGAWRLVRQDENFRRLAPVALLAAISPLVFPHYQALARERLGLSGSNLMVWVVVQNTAVGVFGLLLGWVTDRRGVRTSLRMAVFCAVLAPLAAVALSGLAPALGRRYFWLVFIPLGSIPVMMRTMILYNLEMAPPTEHPRYLSTLSMCLVLPVCFSPAVGWLCDATSFGAVFLVAAGLIFLGGLMTLRLREPGHHLQGTLDRVMTAPEYP